MTLNPSEIILTLAAHTTASLSDEVRNPTSAVSLTLGEAMRARALQQDEHSPNGTGAFASGVLWERAMAAAPGLREQAAALGLDPGGFS